MTLGVEKLGRWKGQVAWLAVANNQYQLAAGLQGSQAPICSSIQGLFTGTVAFNMGRGGITCACFYHFHFTGSLFFSLSRKRNIILRYTYSVNHTLVFNHTQYLEHKNNCSGTQDSLSW